MQEQIIVKPAYTGPRVIEVYLKKSKGHASLGRMISTTNKRFFVLDMNRLLFYYLPEKDAMLANATQIPLDSINRIYVEHNPTINQQEQTVKGFTILTKKKAYKLLCDSQLIMEQLLFAFSNLVGAQSQTPLYDWNSYYSNTTEEVVSPVSQTHRRSASKEPTFNNTMHQRRGSNVNNRSPVRVAYNSQSSQEYQNPNPVKETVIKTQSREMNNVEVEEKKSLPRNLEPEQSVQQPQQQISPKNEAEESRPIQENEVERSSSPSQQEKERRSPSKENQQARGRTMGLSLNQVQNSEHMVEVQSLDVPSKSNSDEAKNVPALSSRQLQSFRRSSVSRQKAGGFAPTSIPVGKIENSNSVPLKIDHEITKVMKISGDATTIETNKTETNKYMSKSDPASSLSRKPHPRRDAEEGYAFSPTEEKRAEVIDSDMPLSYLDIMKLKKKEKSNPQYQPEISVPVTSSKYKQVEVEDDWDNELFGDGKLSPVKTQKKVDNNYNSQYISQPNQSSAQISKLNGFNERKPETAVGKTETFAVRGYVHNDWDDDL